MVCRGYLSLRRYLPQGRRCAACLRQPWRDIGMAFAHATLLLDLLISVNIAAAVTLLLVAIYVSDALKIATFPTLLLLTTLFRLAVSIATTARSRGPVSARQGPTGFCAR